MKRILIGALVVMVLSGLVPQSGRAMPPDFIFDAHGVVTENGLPVEGAAVSVSCGLDGASTGTNADGSYSVSFSTCFLGSTVYIWAAKGDSFGSASVLGTPSTTLNVELFKQTDTIITGNVSDHGHVVSGANVVVKCGSLERRTITDIHGEYSVVILSVDCPVGSHVQVSASEGGRSGTISTVVKLVNTINIAIANVGIPEFGVVSSILTAGAGVGVIALHRYRYNKIRV